MYDLPKSMHAVMYGNTPSLFCLTPSLLWNTPTSSALLRITGNNNKNIVAAYCGTVVFTCSYSLQGLASLCR